MSGVYAHRPVRCRTCDAVVQRKSFRDHLRVRHQLDVAPDESHYEEMTELTRAKPGRRRSTPSSSKIGMLPVTCAICGKVISRRNNLRVHVQSQHREHAHRPLRELIAATAALPVPVTRPEPVVVELPPLTADEIVQTVVEQLAGPAGLMPVAQLGAVLVWHEATLTFVRQLGGAR